MTAASRPTRVPDQTSPPPPEPAARRGSRRWLAAGVVGLALVGSLIWGIPKVRYSRAHASTDNAQVDGHIIPVLAKVGGYVRSVRVTDNQKVAEATVLVELDTMELAERVAEVTAELRGAEAAAGVGPETGQAEAMVESAANQRAATEAE